jgi:hypothetical protein
MKIVPEVLAIEQKSFSLLPSYSMLSIGLVYSFYELIILAENGS